MHRMMKRASESTVTAIICMLLSRWVSLCYDFVFLRGCNIILFENNGVTIPSKNLLICGIRYDTYPPTGGCSETLCFRNTNNIGLVLSVGSSEFVDGDKAESIQSYQNIDKDMGIFCQGSQFYTKRNVDKSSLKRNPSVSGRRLIQKCRGGASGDGQDFVIPPPQSSHSISMVGQHREQGAFISQTALSREMAPSQMPSYASPRKSESQEGRDITRAQQKLNNPWLPLEEVPLRFLRAGKGDPVEGKRRYDQTIAWRRKHGTDNVIKKPHPNFFVIKQHYPQFFHLRGYHNEPVWYEKPAEVNLKALRGFGISLDEVINHYAMVTEFGWQYLEPNDFSRSITVIDLEGIRLTDFVGDVKSFVRKAAAFTGQHYPERAGYVFVINVPSWFKLIWKVVKGFVDEATLQKILILRGKQEIIDALQSKIPLENIPPEYGGTSMPLGFSPEEYALRQFMKHNNNFAVSHGTSCAGPRGNPPCPFCKWEPVRKY
mmetsp:Transcript_26113/g.38634  ORF Transcript_26113/g.38634 Transcript_26113/m.38634 type:complete len:488 (+) Transcript_26113:134-1597(+)